MSATSSPSASACCAAASSSAVFETDFIAGADAVTTLRQLHTGSASEPISSAPRKLVVGFITAEATVARVGVGLRENGPAGLGVGAVGRSRRAVGASTAA